MPKGKISKYPFRKSAKRERLEIPIKQNDEEEYGSVEGGIWYPTAKLVEEAHLLMLQKYGGFSGYERGIGVFDVILNDAKDSKSIYEKAAIFLYNICNCRIYKDGNHRTAIVITETFLNKNGIRLGTDDSEKIYKFVKSIALYEINEIIKWLKNGTVK